MIRPKEHKCPEIPEIKYANEKSVKTAFDIIKFQMNCLGVAILLLWIVVLVLYYKVG